MSSTSELVREAYRCAGEKRFPLARLLYSALFGSNWGHAVLGFAYMKLVDDLVDEDPDGTRALATLAVHRQFVRDVYAGAVDGRDLPPPQRYGYPFLCFDRDRGAPLRVCLETILESMEVDTKRRGAVLLAAELDARVVELGSHVIRFVLHFAAPTAVLPPEFLRCASRAYLNADALIDLDHDLRFGVINVPCEDLERGDIRLDFADAGLRAWLAARSQAVLCEFKTALRQSRHLDRCSLRVLAGLYLSTKRRRLCRFVAASGLAA